MIGVIKPFRKALSYHLVITSFEKAFLRLSERCLFLNVILRLLERRYNAYLKSKRRNNTFSLRIIMPFSGNYAFLKRRFKAFSLFFSTQFDTNRLS